MTTNCKYCNNSYRIRCPRCSGQRYITDTRIYTYRDDDRDVPCSQCGLRGWIPCHCVRPAPCQNKRCRGYNYPNCPCGDAAYRFLLGNRSEQSK